MNPVLYYLTDNISDDLSISNQYTRLTKTLEILNRE